MALLDFEDPGQLVAPALVVAFDGWVNAGNAGTAAAEHLIADAAIVGRFDADLLYDYRAVRPTVLFDEGVMADVEFPEAVIAHRRFGERDLLVITGTEPNWNWQRLGGEIANLATSLGIVDHISLGGIPWATPHTRLTSLIETASDRALLPDDADHPTGMLRAPGSVMSAIEWFVGEQGIPTHGFWARVPHYVGATYWPAAVALIERIGGHLSIAIPYGSLVDQAAEQRRRLDEILEEQPEIRAVVERLEAMSPEDQPSGEELAAEIERFLQQQGEDPPGP
ncbi:MAG: PAC2 family protein [Acidimicrobiia bacterium]|nr:PAC2 family protein [Acidimicrobiia bacterium]